MPFYVKVSYGDAVLWFAGEREFADCRDRFTEDPQEATSFEGGAEAWECACDVRDILAIVEVDGGIKRLPVLEDLFGDVDPTLAVKVCVVEPDLLGEHHQRGEPFLIVPKDLLGCRYCAERT